MTAAQHGASSELCSVSARPSSKPTTPDLWQIITMQQLSTRAARQGPAAALPARAPTRPRLHQRSGLRLGEHVHCQGCRHGTRLC